MQDALSQRSQKQRDRLAYIEFRLWFLGDACRRDLMERFGIAPAMATRDFTAYRELAPENIDFDGRRKVYVPSERFAPVFEHEPEPVSYTHLDVYKRQTSHAAPDADEWPWLPPQVPAMWGGSAAKGVRKAGSCRPGDHPRPRIPWKSPRAPAPAHARRLAQNVDVYKRQLHKNVIIAEVLQTARMRAPRRFPSSMPSRV